MKLFSKQSNDGTKSLKSKEAKRQLKLSPLEKMAGNILAFLLAGVVLLLPLHAFLSTWLGASFGEPLVWKSWKEIILLGMLFVGLWLCVRQPVLLKLLWSRLINKLIIAYVLLHLLMALFSSASGDAIIAGLMMNLRFFTIFAVAQLIILLHVPLVQRIKTLLPVWLLWIMLGLGVLAILQVEVLPKDFLTNFGYNKDTSIAPYVLVDENPDALRAFATMRGPNTLGAYLLLPLAFALYFAWQRRNTWLAWASLAFGAAALALTGSRSAWIGFIIMCVVLLALWLPRNKLKKIIKRGAIPTALVIILLFAAAVNIPAMRLAIFHSSPGDASLFEGSTEKHLEEVIEGATEVITHPLGSGVGSSGPASFYNTATPADITENYYLQIGQEVGLLGLGLFIYISVVVARHLFRQKDYKSKLLLASFVGISIINLFLHGWADDPTSMTWWAIAGLYWSEK